MLQGESSNPGPGQLVFCRGRQRQDQRQDRKKPDHLSQGGAPLYRLRRFGIGRSSARSEHPVPVAQGGASLIPVWPGREAG